MTKKANNNRLKNLLISGAVIIVLVLIAILLQNTSNRTLKTFVTGPGGYEETSGPYPSGSDQSDTTAVKTSGMCFIETNTRKFCVNADTEKDCEIAGDHVSDEATHVSWAWFEGKVCSYDFSADCSISDHMYELRNKLVPLSPSQGITEDSAEEICKQQLTSPGYEPSDYSDCEVVYDLIKAERNERILYCTAIVKCQCGDIRPAPLLEVPPILPPPLRP